MMQIYSGLHTRNAFGLKIRTLTGGTDDATELIVGLGPQGRFDPGFATLSSLTGELAAMKEYHHFYPVLFYFRFEEPYYSTYHSTLMLLDTGHLLKSTLNDEEFIGYPHASMGRN